ncbi:hypothetical protein G3M48_008373, partial [Beauveria asiatica]
MFSESTHSFTHLMGQRPPFLTNPDATGIQPRDKWPVDKPRTRFNYVVEVRKCQQKNEWLASQINQNMFGDTASQAEVATKWAADLWQRWGIWNSEWEDYGPGAQDQWENGLPACLLAMELAWEIEHMATLRRPVDVSKLCWTKAPENDETPPLDWSWDLVVALAAERIFSRHRDVGFPSKIELATVAFRQDLKSLSGNLPEPVQKLVATVENWDDLRLPPGTQTEGRSIFGPIATYSKPSTLNADRAPDPFGLFKTGRLFGTSQQEASTQEAPGPSDSESEYEVLVKPLKPSRPRDPAWQTVRNCANWQDVQRFLGVSEEQARSMEANGACKPETGRPLFGVSHLEASPFQEAVVSTTESGRRLFGMSVQESSGRPVGEVRSPGNEEAVQESGRVVAEVRSPSNEQVLPKVGEQAGGQAGGARNSDIAAIAASLRAMRPRRRESRPQP